MNTKTEQNLCSIIIPVFNQLPYTRQCVDALLRNTSYPEYEILIMDNGSSDGTPEYLQDLQQRHERIRIQRFEENRGFSEANNIGAEQARGEHLIFLNNDTIPTAGWLSALVECMSQRGVGLAGAKLVYPHNNTINHIGYVYSRELKAFYGLYHKFLAGDPVVNEERELQAVLGAAIIMPRQLFMQVGMFADFGLEDIDLCLKVRRAGFRVLYCPHSLVYHYGSVTLGCSAPGEVPMMTPDEFGAHWPSSTLLADDQEHYRIDGFNVKWGEGYRLHFRHDTDRSYELLDEALLLLDLKKYGEAEQVFQQILALNASSRHALIWLSNLASLRSDFDQAFEYLLQALESDPLNNEVYVLAARLCIVLGKPQTGFDLLERLLGNPDLPFGIKEKAAVVREQLSAEAAHTG